MVFCPSVLCMYYVHTFVEEVAERETEVEVEDSELADSLSGDPGRFTFFRFRGRPFNLGAKWLHK